MEVNWQRQSCLVFSPFHLIFIIILFVVLGDVTAVLLCQKLFITGTGEADESTVQAVNRLVEVLPRVRAVNFLLVLRC